MKKIVITKKDVACSGLGFLAVLGVWLNALPIFIAMIVIALVGIYYYFS